MRARHLDKRRAPSYTRRWASGNNSVVECDLAKVEVAGSNPVSRSKTSSLRQLLNWRGTQVVRERSAKPLCDGSIPSRASKDSKAPRWQPTRLFVETKQACKSQHGRVRPLNLPSLRSLQLSTSDSEQIACA